MAVGERTYRADQGSIDYDEVRKLMDPLDTGETTFPKRWKQAVADKLQWSIVNMM